MSLKFKFILFIGILHCIMIVLIYYVLKEYKYLFIASELLVFISLYVSYALYKSFIRPIDLLQSGTDAIADADFSIKYLKTGSREIDKLIDVFNSMIDKLREERTLMSQQSYFIQNLIEVTPIGIVIMDFDGKISNMNPSAKKIFKIKSNPVGLNLLDFNSQLINEIKKIEDTRSTVISLNGLEKYKCQINDVIHQGFKRQFILIDDLSSELLVSEKEAYGRIIRMMAHEVNNSMGAINSILDSVVEFGFSDSQDDELKESLLIAKRRNKSLSQFMANYASVLRLPEPHIKKMNLNQLVKKSGQLFIPTAKNKNIEIVFKLGSGPISINGDAVMLEQALSNIIKNAIEAIHTDGQIIISTSASPNQFTIADNGSGILPENTSKLFKPFFTTKATGQGVGLMLIREILHLHKTSFSLKAEDGWTKFNVIFK